MNGRLPQEVGFAVVEKSGQMCVVRALRVRSQFRDLGLADLLARELRGWADAQGMSGTEFAPVDDGSEALRTYAAAFQRQGIRVQVISYASARQDLHKASLAAPAAPANQSATTPRVVADALS